MAVTISSSGNVQDWEGTATDSHALPIATTTKTFNTATGKRFLAGDTVQATATAAKYPTFIIGTVSSYSAGSLVIAPTNVGGRIFSKSSITIGTGSKSFLVGSRYSSLFTNGDPIRISSIGSSTATRFMIGTITSYTASTGILLVNVTSTQGSGTLTDWVICSDGTFTAWDLIWQWGDTLNITSGAVLSCTQTPLMPHKFSNCLTIGSIQISNSSTTTPLIYKANEPTGAGSPNNTGWRLEQNGFIQSRGGWISLGTGDGTSAQTLPVPATIDFPSYVEVETSAGSGVYRPWVPMPADFDDSYVPSSYVPKTEVYNGEVVGDYVFFKGATNTIECGDGINGNVFPNGSNVRIANIHITCDLPEPTTLATTFGDCNLTGSHTNTTGSKAFTAATGMSYVGGGTESVIVERIGDATCRMTATVTSYVSGTGALTVNVSAIVGYALATYTDWRLLDGRNFNIGDTSNNSGSQPTTNWSGVIGGERIAGTRTGSAISAVTRNSLFMTGWPLHTIGDNIYYVLDNTGTNNAAVRVAQIDLAPSGKADLEITSLGRCAISTSDSSVLRLVSVGASSPIYMTSSQGNITIDGLSTGVALAQSGGNGALKLLSVLGTVSIKKVRAWGLQVNTGGNSTDVVTLLNLPDVEMLEDISSSIFYNRRTNGSAAFNIASIVFQTGYTPNKLYIIGGKGIFQDCANQDWEEIYLADDPDGLQTNGNYADNLLQIVRCTNVIFRTIRSINAMKLAATAWLTIDQYTINAVVHDVDFSVNDCASLATTSCQTAGSNCWLSNVTMGICAVSNYNSMNRSVSALVERGLTYRNVKTSTVGTLGGTGQGWALGNSIRMEGNVGYQSYYLSAGTGCPSYQDCSNMYVFRDVGLSTGRLSLGFSIESSKDLYDFTGTTYTNNAGRLYLEGDGDICVMKSINPVMCMTGGQNSAPTLTGANTGSITVEFRYCQWGEDVTVEAWQTLDATNWDAVTSADVYKGLDVQFRFTGVGAVSGRYLDQVLLGVDCDAAWAPAASETTINITGAIDESHYALIDNDGPQSIINSKDVGVSGASSIRAQFPADGNLVPIIVRIRKYGCVSYDVVDSFYIADKTYAIAQVSDSEITEPIEATVTAYSTLETVEKIYDYLSYWVGLRENMLLDQLCTKSGSALNFGSFDLVFDATAASVLTKVGNTITIKASVIDLGSITTTGTITLSNGCVTGTTLLSGSNGASGLLQLLGLTSTAVYVKDNSNAEVDYAASVTGTYSLIIPFGSTGTWTWVTKRLGYRHAVGNFTASDGGNFINTPSMPEKLNPDGTAMYAGSSSLLCEVSFDGTTQANIDIGDGVVTLQEAFDESETSLATNDGMIWLASGKSDTSQFNSAGGDYFFLSTGWRLRRASAGDVNATIESFVIGADGTVVDGVNGSVQFLTSDSPTAIAQAVLVALQGTFLDVNIARVNGYDVGGEGTDATPWGPAV